MATLGKLPATPKPALISSGKAVLDFADVTNGIIKPVNDSINDEKRAEGFPFYAAKVEGCKKEKEFSDVSGVGKGAFIYLHPDPDATNRDHTIMAFGNKIKVKIGDYYSTIRDVSVDGYAIGKISVVQAKRYAYIAIGDEDLSEKLYRYDGITNNVKSVSSVADNGSGKARFTTSAAHGLYDGDYIQITGTTDYNGEFYISYVSSTSFDILSLDYTSSQTGTATGHPKSGAPISITALNASKNLFPMEDRIGSIPIGTSSNLPQYSFLKNDGDFTDFTSGTATDEGGEFSGDLKSVNFGINFRSLYLIFEDNQITIHSIKPPIYVGGTASTDLSKDTDTLKEGFTIDGIGCRDPKACTVGLGLLYFIDPKKGVYQYDAITQRLQNLSQSFQSVFKKYDFTDAAIAVHPIEELLIVSASTVSGVANNINLIYNFQTKRWSTDLTKNVKEFIWNPVQKKMYALSSDRPELLQVYDGTFSTDTGSEIEMVVNTVFYDGGRRGRYKEYLESSVEIGFEDDAESIQYKLFIDNNSTPEVDELVDISLANRDMSIEPDGPYGDTVVGEGYGERDRSLIFKRYFNDDPIDDFKKASLQVRERSAYNFVVGFPELVALPTDDEVSDF